MIYEKVPLNSLGKNIEGYDIYHRPDTQTFHVKVPVITEDMEGNYTVCKKFDGLEDAYEFARGMKEGTKDLCVFVGGKDEFRHIEEV